VGLQQVVQPSRPGSCFERDAQISKQPVDELQNGARLRLWRSLSTALKTYSKGAPFYNVFIIVPPRVQGSRREPTRVARCVARSAPEPARILGITGIGVGEDDRCR